MKRTFFLFMFALTLALSAAACGDVAVPARRAHEPDRRPPQGPAKSLTLWEEDEQQNERELPLAAGRMIWSL